MFRSDKLLLCIGNTVVVVFHSDSVLNMLVLSLHSQKKNLPVVPVVLLAAHLNPRLWPR